MTLLDDWRRKAKQDRRDAVTMTLLGFVAPTAGRDGFIGCLMDLIQYRTSTTT